jgi:hypothetical protein
LGFRVTVFGYGRFLYMNGGVHISEAVLYSTGAFLFSLWAFLSPLHFVFNDLGVFGWLWAYKTLWANSLLMGISFLNVCVVVS